MQTTNQPQTTNNSEVRDASVQISANKISTEMQPKFYALPNHIQKLIREYLDERYSASIWDDSELMEAYLATQGIFGYTSGVLKVAYAIHNPLPLPGSDPSRPVYDLELSTRIQNALVNAGIQSLGQLATADRITLFKIPHIGTMALRQINDVLVANGYSAKE